MKTTIPPLEDFIRRAHDAVPMVGLLRPPDHRAGAWGTVVKHPGGWAVGTQDGDFWGEPVRLNAWHQDQVGAAAQGTKATPSAKTPR